MPELSKFTSKDGKVLRTRVPGGYSFINTLTKGGTFARTNNVVLVGGARSGNPYELMWFRDLTSAQAILHSGELVEALNLALNPGDNMVPERIGVMRADSALAASRTFNAGGSPIWDMTATQAGTLGNAITSSLATGTVAGTKKITIQQNGIDVSNSPFDNISDPRFTVTYTGEGTTKTISVDFEKITITIDGSPTVINYKDFSKVQGIISYIDGLVDLSCVTVASNNDISPIDTDGYGIFDWLDNANLSTAVVVTANVRAIFNKINIGQSDVIMTYHTGFSGNRKMANNDTNWVYLSGGSNGTLSTTEWGKALTALEKEDVQIIVPISASEGIHAMFQTHCEKMSDITGKNERMCLVGGDWGESNTDCITRVVSYNSAFVMNIYPGGQTLNSMGMIVNVPAYMLAAQVSGAVAALDFNEPLTWKRLKLISLERTHTRAEYENLLEKGICSLFIDSGGNFAIMRQLTTYQGDDIIKNEWSLWRGALMVTKDMREFTENRERSTGRKGTNRVYTALRQDILNRMKSYVIMGWLAESLDGKQPSYQLNNFTITADKIYIDWTGLLVAPINFEFIQNNFTVIGAV